MSTPGKWQSVLSFQKARQGDITAMASTLTNLIYHIIFSTKNRMCAISPTVKTELYLYIGGIIKNKNGTLLEIGGVEDHIHLVIKLKSADCLADMIRFIKANSSKWLNERFVGGNRFAWQAGYGAFTVSASQLRMVRDYVLRQEEHHKGRSFQDEFLAFIKSNEIEYEPERLWG